MFIPCKDGWHYCPNCDNSFNPKADISRIATALSLPPEAGVEEIVERAKEGRRITVRLLNVARGCLDYGGGYRVAAELEIFHHGIHTVINALTAAVRNDPADWQTKMLESMGRQG